MVTPFLPDGGVDFTRLTAHANNLIENGIDFLVVLGTTAETPTLKTGEKEDIVRAVVEANGKRVPLMVGAGSNDTQAVIESISGLNKDGVDGLLSVVPYYNKPTQEGIFQHYSGIAAISELPVLLYNVPGRTGCHMSGETALRLAHAYPEVIFGVKEASGNFDQISQLLRDKPDSFMVLSGDDALTLPMLSMGASGVISVIANGYPEVFSAMVQAALEDRMKEARELHHRLSPMMKAIFKEGNPAGIKAAMEIRGWIDNVLRLPLVPATGQLLEEIRTLNGELLA
jgi:4-hydroxy-tetrahydrodipicolinate synthase